MKVGPIIPTPSRYSTAAIALHWLSGWLYSSATGVSVVYLGLVPLPDLVPKDKALAALLKGVHVGLNSGLALLVIIHAGAALKHQFVERDGVLARMLPFLQRPAKG